MSDYAKSLNDLARAGAQNGRIEAFGEVLAIIEVIAADETVQGRTACLRIINAIGLHQERVIAGVTAERAIARAAL